MFNNRIYGYQFQSYLKILYNKQKTINRCCYSLSKNVGLIQLYQTVFERAKSLSIDASQPYMTSGISVALQLDASRLAQFYMLLGNEAYTDALDPTIGFTTNSTEYGSLAPSIFTFMDQVPKLIDEQGKTQYRPQILGSDTSSNNINITFKTTPSNITLFNRSRYVNE